MTDNGLPAVRRQVEVGCDPATAFRLFTEHIGSWWPLATHGVLGPTASVAFEGDGSARRLVERRGDREVVWGEVIEHDPPRGFRMTWHPGYGAEQATEVAVTFTADGAGTLVSLVHTGWERHRAPRSARDGYETGWPVVLGHLVTYAAVADAAAAARP